MNAMAVVDKSAPDEDKAKAPDVQEPAPLISSSAATQSTSAASMGAAGAIVVILLWLLSLGHIEVPADVSIAISVIVSAGVHWIMIKFGMPTS